MPLLDVRNLSVSLRTSRGLGQAVRGLSFTLEPGEKLGIVGESGCGKSITALALLGLLPEGAAVDGEIIFNGSDLRRSDSSELERLRGNRIAMVFQEPMTSLNPLHTLGDQVAEPLVIHKGLGRSDARREALALLDRVGIPDASRRMDAYPHQISGGQRQRVMIAMALACGPELLIADEPTTALDVTIQGQILDLLLDVTAEKGMSLILISHNLGIIAETVDRVVVMYGGTAVEEGSVDAVFGHFAHPYSRGLFAAMPRIDARPGERLATIAGTVPELFELPPGCRFADRCPIMQPECNNSAVGWTELGPGHRAACRMIGEQ